MFYSDALKFDEGFVEECVSGGPIGGAGEFSE